MNQDNRAQDTLEAEKQPTPATDQTAIRNDAGDRRPEGQPLGKPGEGSAQPMAHPPADASEAEGTRRQPEKSGR